MRNCFLNSVCVFLLLMLITIPAIAMIQASAPKEPIANQDQISPSPSPEVKAAASRVDSLDRSYAWWNNRALALLFVAGIIGIFAVIFQIKSNRDSTELKRANDDLNAAKDRQLRSELNSGTERTTKLENDNLNLRGQVLTLESGAADSASKLADALERQAKAEAVIVDIRHKQQDRHISPNDIGPAVRILKNAPSGSARIWYQPNDGEAELFARDILSVLKEGGWKLPSFEEPIPANISLLGFTDISGDDARLSPTARARANARGVTIVSRMDFPQTKGRDSFSALIEALNVAIGAININGTPESVAIDTDFIIVVAAHP